jgi:hypothetical protein
VHVHSHAFAGENRWAYGLFLVWNFFCLGCTVIFYYWDKIKEWLPAWMWWMAVAVGPVYLVIERAIFVGYVGPPIRWLLGVYVQFYRRLRGQL